MSHDINGNSVGKALGGTTETAPGYMLFSMIHGRESRFDTNPQDVKDFTSKESNILAEYWLDRQGNPQLPKEVAERLIKIKTWEKYTPTYVKRVFENRAKSVLESPTSALPLEKDNNRLAAKLRGKLA